MPRGLPVGIVRTTTGYRTFQWVPDPERPNGRIASKRWKADATLTEMSQWRETQRVEARKPRPIADAPATLTGFAADAVTYLETVRALATHKWRVKEIAEWIAVIGDAPSLEIEPRVIRAARDQWLTIGPKRVLQKVKGEKARWVSQPLPLSASSVNHRLRALENFFTVMYPRHPNPVRQVAEVEEPTPAPRGQSFALGLEILGYMPDITKPVKGGTHEPGSLSRVRYEAMLWTGLPAAQLAALTPAVVDWQARTFRPTRRKKGKQSRRARRRHEAPRPLLPQAIAALKRFFALEANRRFSSSSLNQSVKRAIRAANQVRTSKGLPRIPETLTVYDLTRHTFGTEAMRASKNLKAVQDLMGHADINQTARYAMAGVAEQNVEAIRQLAQYVDGPRPRGALTSGKVSPRSGSGRERSGRTRVRQKR